MKTIKTYFPLFLLIFLLSNSCNIEKIDGELSEQINDDKDSPIEEEPATTCEEAILNATNLASSFATATESNYIEMCNAYKTVLQQQIDLCGDDGGTLQFVLDNIGDCNPIAIGGGNETDVRAFMTANINGDQYDDMKPNSYLFFPGGVSVNGFFTRDDDDYLVMQGNSGYKNPTFIDVADREINLKIPKANWKEGTYVLYDDLNDVFEGVCYYTFFAFNQPGSIIQIDHVGEITISKFSLEEKLIEGTFKFEYSLLDENTEEQEGPFKVTGTFDYSLDDEYFD